MDYKNLPEDLLSYINVEAGLARIMGNSKVYLRMLKIFMDTEEFDSFRESIAASDYEKASEIAHTIKGMTGNLSFTKLYEISAALTDGLRKGIKDDELIKELYSAKDKTMDFINVLIKELA